MLCNLFLSTPSARRATTRTTHAAAFNDEFLSTPSARRATCAASKGGSFSGISIHALREEGDYGISLTKRNGEIFLSTPSARRATSSMGISPAGTLFLSTPSARRATAKTERKPSVFVSLYTSLHKLQRGVCKASHKITPLLAQTAGIPVRSVQENHVRFLFALVGHHPDIKRSAHYPVQTPGAVQRARPWSGNCCPAGRTADCPRRGRSGRSALP